MAQAQGEAAGEAGDEGYFASVSDLMVGILFVFLLVLTVFALNFREAEQEQTIERSRYEALQRQADAAERRAEEAERRALEEERRAREAQALAEAERRLLEDQRRRADEAERRAEAAEHRALEEEEAARLARERALAAERRALEEEDLARIAQALADEKEVEAEAAQRRTASLRELLAAAVEQLERETELRMEARGQLLEAVRKSLDSRGVQVRVDERSGILRLSGDLLFRTGSAALGADAQATVATIAEVLADVLPCYAVGDTGECPTGAAPVLEAVLVEGHTDRQPYQSNDQLSAARALSVFAALRDPRSGQQSLDGLLNADGLPLFGISGYGERRPLPEALGDSQEEYQRNRRIDLRFVLSTRSSEELEQLRERIAAVLGEGE